MGASPDARPTARVQRRGGLPREALPPGPSAATASSEAFLRLALCGLFQPAPLARPSSDSGLGAVQSKARLRTVGCKRSSAVPRSLGRASRGRRLSRGFHRGPSSCDA